MIRSAEWTLEELTENIEHNISLIPPDDDYTKGLIDGLKDALKMIQKKEDELSLNKDDHIFDCEILDDSLNRKMILAASAQRISYGIACMLYERDEQKKKEAELITKRLCIDMFLILYAEVGDCNKKELIERFHALRKHSDDSGTSIMINDLIRAKEENTHGQSKKEI